MKKNKFPVWAGIVLGIVIFALLIGLYVGGTYNSMVGLDESVNNAWGKVQSAYQRRADLIPNLVATVKAYSDYEGEVLTQIVEARASVGSAKTPAELAEAGDQMNSALSRLLVVVEAYPDLKANQNYLDLQAELAGTENRIKVERDLFNNAVKEFNTKVRRFPSNLIAGMFGFSQKEYFESKEGSEDAPDVKDLFQ
ncbi:MAG: LemA family protein [Candidatus Woesearchaeota archaeon]|nr:LemA family protein [Candidatus Woesearchaeota archaeon]